MNVSVDCCCIVMIFSFSFDILDTVMMFHVDKSVDTLYFYVIIFHA